MDYEIVASVIDSAKRIVEGRGTDEDEMDIQEWGAEVIVALDRDLGNMEMHLRKLVDIMERTVYNPYQQVGQKPPDIVNNVYPVWRKAHKYLKSLEE